MNQATNSGGATRTTWSGLASIGGWLVAAAAVAIGAVLMVFAATAVVILAVMTSVTLGLAILASKVGRRSRVRARDRDNGIIEARKVGGHHWVAYGWNERR
jgi:hypothetical protein